MYQNINFMDFAHPYILYLLAVIPVLVALFIWARVSRRRKLARFGNPAVIASLMPESSKYIPIVKIALQSLALAALIIALARPRYGEKKVDEERNGIEVMIAVDVSRSMLASSTDDSKSVSRLNRAKRIFSQLIDNLENDKVGIVVFAGDAYLQLPITTDFVSAKIYLDEISTDMINVQGTDIGAAISKALDGFTSAKDVNKAIVLITDCEDHEQRAVEIAKKAREAGVQVDVIGIGSTKGALIPLSDAGNEFLKDSDGNPVTTVFNPTAAQAIAQAGGGFYVNGSESNATTQMLDHLDKIEKADLGNVEYTAAAERFYIFLWIAFALIIVDIFILDRKIGWLSKINFFSKPLKE